MHHLLLKFIVQGYIERCRIWDIYKLLLRKDLQLGKSFLKGKDKFFLIIIPKKTVSTNLVVLKDQ